MREHGAKPGVPALEALRAIPAADLPDEGYHAYIAGEQALPTDARRHLVADRGVSKDHISFCGYWRVGAASPTPKSQLAPAEAHS